jgi:hypothetical protein
MGYCDRGNGFLGSIKVGLFLHQLIVLSASQEKLCSVELHRLTLWVNLENNVEIRISREVYAKILIDYHLLPSITADVMQWPAIFGRELIQSQTHLPLLRPSQRLLVAKVRLFLVLNKYHTIQMYGEVEVGLYLHTFLTSAPDGGEGLASHPGRFTPE